ncbi:tyrosinase-like isoform X2 [Eleutherodactylus coqui]|uniref:tyrosinase-like isoform X2 n=1 Tax=Eleutherodactylus coqui TaxID=57060 RepID=UPI003461C103
MQTSDWAALEMLLLSVVLLMCLAATDAILFPSICPPNLPNRVPCCPSYNGSACGYDLGRGRCLEVPKPKYPSMDERDAFPSAYYTHMCVCNGNYGSYDCGGCTFNRNGTNCDLQNIVRREARQLTPTELTAYLAKLHYCKTKIDPDYLIMQAGNRLQASSYQFFLDSYYNGWCYEHYYATKPFLNNSREIYITNCAHGSTAFLTWHRLFLLGLENSMQRCLRDPSFALVYCDWQRDPGCAFCNNQYFGANDATGFISPLSIFSGWRSVCGNFDHARTYCLMGNCICERQPFRRRYGYVDVPKPNKADVDYCLSLGSLDRAPYTAAVNGSFRSCIEGWINRYGQQTSTMHNLWHVYLGGTMSQVPIACNDPMFVCHHLLIDKFFEQWIRRYNANSNSYPNNPIYCHGPYDYITPSYYRYQHRDMVRPLSSYGVTFSIYEGS